MLSITASLLRIKKLNTFSYSSVVKSEFHLGSLKDIKDSMESAETRRIFSANEGPIFLKKELNF